jgi:hypothetical protein
MIPDDSPDEELTPELSGAPTDPKLELGEDSFPASDPPSVWTWEVDRPPRLDGPAH